MSDGRTGRLSSGSLVKLRELPKNRWHVDDLYLLSRTRADAQRLIDIAAEEDWMADNVELHDDVDELADALGWSPVSEVRVASFWWD